MSCCTILSPESSSGSNAAILRPVSGSVRLGPGLIFPPEVNMNQGKEEESNTLVLFVIEGMGGRSSGRSLVQFC